VAVPNKVKKQMAFLETIHMSEHSYNSVLILHYRFTFSNWAKKVNS